MDSLFFVVMAYALCRHNDRLVLLFSATVSLLVASLVLRTGFLRTLLSNSVLVFTGKRSYAMYLVHVLAINAVEKILPKFFKPHWSTVIGLTYGLSLLVAALLQIVVEGPCIEMGRRVSASLVGKIPPRTGTAVAA